MEAVALFVLGAPGVGKTSLVRSILGMPERTPALIERPAKWTVKSGPDIGPIQDICAAGWYSGETFDGGDTVAYNGVKASLDFWEAKLLPRMRLTIFDGDRFSNGPAFDRISRVASVAGLLLRAAPSVLEHRRLKRGSDQDPTWIKGRVTKAENFARLVKRSGWTVKVLEQRLGLSPRAGARLVLRWLGEKGGW